MPDDWQGDLEPAATHADWDDQSDGLMIQLSQAISQKRIADALSDPDTCARMICDAIYVGLQDAKK